MFTSEEVQSLDEQFGQMPTERVLRSAAQSSRFSRI
jgi:hypothetical protein